MRILREKWNILWGGWGGWLVLKGSGRGHTSAELVTGSEEGRWLEERGLGEGGVYKRLKEKVNRIDQYQINHFESSYSFFNYQYKENIY